MKIGIIGSGEVGQTLATAFLKEGHEVMLGTRNTSKDEVINGKKKILPVKREPLKKQQSLVNCWYCLLPAMLQKKRLNQLVLIILKTRS